MKTVIVFQQKLILVFILLSMSLLSVKASVTDTSNLEVLCKDITVSIGQESYIVLNPLDVHFSTIADTIITDYSLNRDTFFCEDFSNGQIEVTLTVTDICGNSAHCTSTVEFIDLPTLQADCPDDIQIFLAPGICGRFLNFEYGIDNPCADTVYQVQLDDSGLQSGDFFAYGLTEIETLFFTDAGDSVICSFVVDIIPFEPTATEMSCNDMINISLNEYCEATIGADFLLEGNHYRCYDDFLVEISETESGSAISSSPVVSEEHIGDTLYVTICDPVSGNCCWGRIFVEDKLVPPLACEELILDCGDDLSPAALNSYPGVEFGNLCTDTIMSYSDEIISFPCSDSLYVQKIERLWTVTKENGSSSSCIQDIYIKKGNPDSIPIPPHFDGIEEPRFHCSEITDWPINNNGYRIPPVEVTGTVSSTCPNLFASFTDHIFPLCGGSYKVIRNWSIFDHCSVRIVSRPQVILIDNDPMDSYFVEDSIGIGTEAWMCAGRVILSYPEVIDPCVINGNYTFTPLNSDVEIVMENDYILVNNIPVGHNYIDIVIQDECGRKDTATVHITVIDDDVPVAIGDQNTLVSLGSFGEAKVFASSFDDGSLDNCGIDSMVVRRLVEGPCSGTIDDDRFFGPHVGFCCEDIGQTIAVVFRVYDASGNHNEVQVNIRVEDKLAPVITCPPDITVACDFSYPVSAFTDPMDPTFGRMVTDPADRMPVIVSGHGMPGIPDDFVWGNDGMALDNCSVEIDLASIKMINCGRGFIRRNFVATDGDGRSVSCSQTITFEEFNPFTEDNITWPYDPTLHDVCAEDVETNPEVSGMPEIIGDVCSDILVSYEDEIFTQDSDACIKIFRTWKVIDWCQYDSGTGAGVWTNLQVIKLSNNVPPTIFDAPDITVCNVVPDDGGDQVFNGDFESGPSGFTSDFVNNQASIFEEGTYATTINAEVVNSNYRPCVDHTFGAGMFMAINGDTILDKKFWCQTVSVEEGIDYMFGSWMTNLSVFSQAEFAFVVNGEEIGGIRTITADPCEWVEYMDFWTATFTGSVEFCLINKTTSFFRNEIGNR